MSNSQLPSICLVGNFLSRHGKTPDISEVLADRLSSSGVRVLTTSSRLFKPWRVVDMLATLLRRRNDYRVILIITYSGPSFVWALASGELARLLGRPYVAALHGGGLGTFAARWPYLVRRYLEGAASVVSPARMFCELFGRPEQPVRLLVNPISLETIPYTPRATARPRLLWFRAFSEVYQPELAIRVLAQLRERYPDATLTMAGPERDGSMIRCKRLVRELGVEDAVSFPGLVDKQELVRLGSEHDIYLNTTRFESFGIANLEAGAMGLCIVTGAVGEIPHIYQDRHDAMLIDGPDLQGMTDACLEVLGDDALASHLSREGRRLAEKYSWPLIWRDWNDLLLELNTGTDEQ